jgi:hyperosmotically inducible periplasmic protein
MIEPEPRTVLAIAVAAAGLAGCELAERRKLELDAQKALNDAKHAATKAGAEIKRETKEAAAQAQETLKEGGETTGQVIEDAAITAKVKSALHAEKDIRSRGLDVETLQGKVVLKGVVPDKGQVDLANKVARSVEGVKAVENRLSVN